MLVPERVTTEELLDEEHAPLADRDRSLRDLQRINRYLGGVRVYRWIVRALAPRSILDLGTGTSDLLEAVPHVPLRVGLDFRIEHLLYARNGSTVRRVVGDALKLPFRSGAVDLVTSSHFMHHFTPEENAAIFEESLRVSRSGVAVTDTRRHALPLLFVQLLSALRLVGRITRYDAPASVRQGYTPGEAAAIVDRCGAARSSILRKWPFRLVLLLWNRK